MNEFELRRQLRALPRERAPGRDLWIGIAPRLEAKQSRWQRPLALALAASVVAAVSLVALHPQPETAERPVSAALAVMPQLLEREADALDIEYRSAIASADVQTLPRPLQRSALALDADARELRNALRLRPDSTFLLSQLRRTYQQRLRLAQWAQLS